MSQQQSLLQETKDISNTRTRTHTHTHTHTHIYIYIYKHNITQSFHLKLPTSVLCDVPFCILVDRKQCLGEIHRRHFQRKE